MVYNKTKRGLEKAAGIVGVVLSSIVLIVLLVYTGILINAIRLISAYEYYEYDYLIGYTKGQLISYLFIYIAFMIIYISNIILCANVIKSPVQSDGTIRPTKDLRICTLVFCIISGLWVPAGIMIAVLCLKDVQEVSQIIPQIQPTVQIDPAKQMQTVQVAPAQQLPTQTNEPSIESKIAELKHLKDLGVIDEDVYKKAIEKMINDLV